MLLRATQGLPDHLIQLTPLSYVTKASRWEGSKFQSLKATILGQGPQIHVHTKYFLETYK